ncbi:MAG: hypothetical protein WBM61_07685, partial [Woeseiaceae bacterium]
MFKPVTSVSEIVSLAVMLLMVVALVSSQADATIPDEIRANTAQEQAGTADAMKTSLKTTIEAHIIGQPLTI